MAFWHQIRRAFARRRATENRQTADKAGSVPQERLSPDLAVNRSRLKDLLGDSADIVYRELKATGPVPTTVLAIYIDGLVNVTLVNEAIFFPLTVGAIRTEDRPANPKEVLTMWQRHFLGSVSTQLASTYGETVQALLSGNTVLMVNGAAEALLLGTQSWPDRGVHEPDTEAVIRGSKEGFTETLRTNTSLLRRRLRTPLLRFETVRLGRYSQTEVVIVYLKGLAPEDLVQEVRRRLAGVTIDGVLESRFIEDFISDRPWGIFPTVFNTQRPDAVAARLLEGRVAILVEGTPFALTVPALFFDFMQSPEEYYVSPWTGNFLRWLRFVGALLSLYLPALYVVITIYRHELLPGELLISIAAAEEGIPFPITVEILLMGLVFEALREAGVRMPRPVGQAVSIVGALVIGEAAIRAQLASPALIMIVTFTAIATFMIPSNDLAYCFSLLRLLFVLAGDVFCFFGVIMTTILLLLYLNQLKSFGVYYLTPLVPYARGGFFDTLFRVPRSQLAGGQGAGSGFHPYGTSPRDIGRS